MTQPRTLFSQCYISQWRILAAIGLVACFSLVLWPQNARADSPEEMILRSEFTVKRLLSSNTDPNFWENLQKAKAIMIFPSVFKAGFIFGAQGGNGILVARAPNGVWTYPSFHALNAASIGIQVGLENSQVIFLVMSNGALKSIMGTDFKLGVDGSVAFLSKGVTAGVSPDIYAFALSEGAFVGFSLEGAVISSRGSFNQEFYGRDVSSEDIILRHKVSNPFADGLRTQLQPY